MTRLRPAGPRLLRAAVLACLLLLLWSGGARAEFKTLKLPKSGEFQINLDALVQEIPPFPTVVKEDDHYIFTGLEAWGVDKKYMSTFHVYIARRELGPDFISEKDRLEDRLVVYCDDSFWEESYFPIKIGKQEGAISLSPSDPQRTMFLQFADKKDKKCVWRFYANGDVELISNKDHSDARYENGIPEFPACEKEEDSVNCHVAGLSRWGAPEDELILAPGNGVVYSYTPEIPGIREVALRYSENDSVPSITLYMEEGSFSVYDYKGLYMVSPNLPGEMYTEYHYWAGYLCNYTVWPENGIYFHYEPAFALNGNVLAEDGPCPVDESRIPPALSWAAE